MNTPDTPAEIGLSTFDYPNSFFCEVLMTFDERVTETSASRALTRDPEEAIMRAAIRILLGEETVDVWLDVLPGVKRLTFRALRLRDRGSLSTLAAVHDLACEISKTECDEDTGAPTAPTEVLGIAASAVQMAREAFFMGHQRYGRSGASRPMALVALEALLNTIDGVERSPA